MRVPYTLQTLRSSLAIALCAWCVGAAAVETAFRAEVAALSYPTDRRIFTPATESGFDNNLQGVVEAVLTKDWSDTTSLYVEVGAFLDAHAARHIDGELALKRTGRWSVELGLLRSTWGRETGSELDILAPPITAFSLVDDHGTVAQPGVHGWTQLGQVRLDVHALLGLRKQPLPAHDARLGFGVPANDHIRTEQMGRSALAVRTSGSGAAFDWAVHGYHGLARRPAFTFAVTRLGPEVALIYDQITQMGGEFETNVGDWRLWVEGFKRINGRRLNGERDNYEHIAAAAEYQRFQVFDGRYDVFTELRLSYDSRGVMADRPFLNSLRLGWNAIGTGPRPLELELAALYDWEIKGTGVRARIKKQLAIEPYVSIGFEVLAFNARGAARSLLNVFERDTQIALRLEWEI